MLSEAVNATAEKRTPTVTSLESPEERWVTVSVIVERKNATQVMHQLENKGASDPVVIDISNSRQILVHQLTGQNIVCGCAWSRRPEKFRKRTRKPSFCSSRG